MVKLVRRVLGALTVMVAAVGVMAGRDCHAGAVNVAAGYDLARTTTAYLAYPNPSPPPANVLIPFTGLPLNTFAFPGVVPSPSVVGSIDTIIQRKSGGTLTNSGDSFTTAIEVVGLSLFNSGMNLYATLNATPSTGSMEIVYNGVDGGTWTNDFFVHVDIHVGSTSGPIFDTVVKHFTGHGNWLTAPPLGSLIIDGVNKDNNFWLNGAFHDDGGGSVHNMVPEPSSAALLISGALAAGFWRFRRFNS